MTKDRPHADTSEPLTVDEEQRSRALWKQAINCMLNLDDYAFDYEVEQVASGSHRFQLLHHMRTHNTPTSGSLKQGVLYHRTAQFSLLRAGRHLVRGVHDRDFVSVVTPQQNNGSAPLLIDPEALFVLLREQDLEVLPRKSRVGNDPRCEVLSVELTSEQCAELIDAGTIGDPRWIGSFPTRTAGLFDLSARSAPPRFEGHLALFIDPSSRRVTRLRSRIYYPHARVRLDDAEDPPLDPRVVELAKLGKKEVRWVDGLPERRFADNEQRATLDLRFGSFGEAQLPALDERTERLLHLR